MPDPMPTSEILDLIRGQTRLEAKIDNFLQLQSQIRGEVDTLKAEVSALKITHASVKSYVNIAVALVGFGWTLFTIFAVPLIQKAFGI